MYYYYLILVKNLIRYGNVGNRPSNTQILFQEQQATEIKDSPIELRGGAFENVNESPFGYGRGEGVDAGSYDTDWVVEKDREKYVQIFNSLNPVDGKVNGANAKQEMVKSKLPNTVLGKIWKLADVDRDGALDADEFALAMHLINIKISGHDIPATLPSHLVPPAKRGGNSSTSM